MVDRKQREKETERKVGRKKGREGGREKLGTRYPQRTTLSDLLSAAKSHLPRFPQPPK
jgi:hypothetical protein